MEMKLYRNAEELEKEPEDMTDEERERLQRIRAIPNTVKTIMYREIDIITEKIMEWERQRDILVDYLNGECEDGRRN